MQFGISILAQYPEGDDLRERFAEIREQVRLAEKLGFSAVSKGMHYSQAPLQGFQQFPFLARLSGETETIRLVTGVALLSLHKPLDFAEQLATIDVLSNGRLVCGVGMGYREVEFQAFGTTMKERLKRFVENLEAVKRLWTEETVTMQGSHFNLVDATCSTRPIQKPRPPIWLPGLVEPAIRRAARLGDAWDIEPFPTLDELVDMVKVYRSALDEYGKPLPTEFPIRRAACVRETTDEAFAACQPFLEVKYRAYYSWGHGEALPEGEKSTGTGFRDLAHDRFMIGTPDEVADRIVRFNKRVGVNSFMFTVQWPGMPHEEVMESIRQLGEKVLPRVRQAL